MPGRTKSPETLRLLGMKPEQLKNELFKIEDRSSKEARKIRRILRSQGIYLRPQKADAAPVAKAKK